MKLAGAQLGASRPERHVWLSASAGTGKTTVLSARVKRLLLRRGRHAVQPDAILCLTYTKAGAAEMARRVRRDLADWVRMPETELFDALEALGEDAGPDAIRHARQLFARLLEARGAGLRVMTIHSFCQTLLAAFPIEAGVAPGFRPIEGGEADALANVALSDLVNRDEREGGVFVRRLQALSSRLGEAGARSYLTRAAKSLPAFDELRGDLRPRLRGALGVALDFDASEICTACADGAFDAAALTGLRAMIGAWGSPRGTDRIGRIGAWLARDDSARAETLADLRRAWTKSEGGMYETKGWMPPQAEYRALADRLEAWCAELCEKQARAALADWLADALEAARSYALAYDEAKRLRGRVDFDDMIRLTRGLLAKPGIGEWIGYKLDQRTDHVLVDESQDTNAAQWDIVRQLTEEFFTGAGARGGRQRTLFTVGDFKQAIFSFQGTNPAEYEQARSFFLERGHAAERPFAPLSLDTSFRTAQPILDVVDATLAVLGAEAIGLESERLSPHHSSRRDVPGGVTLLPPVCVDGAAIEGEEDWIDDATRSLADQIALRVAGWLRDACTAGDGPALRAGDIMVLVRKRGDLAALLVARLQECGVPVAGVDRLRLRQPLAVQDLLAAMRFGSQPDDDLNLANLLVSPLIGWTQDQLFDAAHDRGARSLWSATRDRGDPATAARLNDWLNAADRITPYAFLEELLSGAAEGRARLVARMGDEIRDPVDELLAAVLAFEAEHGATLQGFLDWFDRNEADVVRDAGDPGDAVRVMTVHGAKGLEARLVILADACVNPESSRASELSIRLNGETLVLPSPNAAERALAPDLDAAYAAQAAASLQEHWRLLYVAMTRAKDHLVVGGALTGRMNEPPASSWFTAVSAGLDSLGATTDADGTRHFGDRIRAGGTRAPSASLACPALPGWLTSPAPAEPRPERPLAPSAFGRDDLGQPPIGPALAAAARRGTLLHGLFERLPTLAPDRRDAAARRWLATRGVAPDDMAALIDPACGLLADPRFARLFSGQALTEAPIAGVVAGVTVAGTVDRLLIGETIEVIDYKTARRVPTRADAVPEYHLRQMAAYRDVLRAIFPDRPVRASLLYTEGPVLHELDDAVLDAHRPASYIRPVTED